MESGFIPRDTFILHRIRKGEPIFGAALTTKDTLKTRTDFIRVIYNMTLSTTSFEKFSTFLELPAIFNLEAYYDRTCNSCHSLWHHIAVILVACDHDH